jgi:hypothetical protein
LVTIKGCYIGWFILKINSMELEILGRLKVPCSMKRIEKMNNNVKN